MGHYAKVKNGTVTQVIVADEDYFVGFVDDSPGTWIKTSYNTQGGVHYDPATGNASADQSKALRKNFAGIDFTYDGVNEAFIPPQPFPSWTLDNTTYLWDPPVVYPDDGKAYEWNEGSQAWDEIT